MTAQMERGEMQRRDSSLARFAESGSVSELLSLAQTMLDRLDDDMRRYFDMKFKRQTYVVISVVFVYSCVAALGIILGPVAAYFNPVRYGVSQFWNVYNFGALGLVALIGLTFAAMISVVRFARMAQFERRIALNSARNVKILLDTLSIVEDSASLTETDAFRLRMIIPNLTLALAEFERLVTTRSLFQW